MPIGEKAYHKGFIVLNTPQIKDLFNITASDTEFKFDSKDGKERLKYHLIPKQCLERINKDSRDAALKGLSKNSSEQISEIRSKEPTFANGKLLGFWLQQFANAELCLKDWTN
jgi:hypothetical protein